MAQIQHTVIARSGKPGAKDVTLADGSTVTGYTLLLEGRDMGNTEWEALFAGARGSLGARAAGAIPQNRRLVLPWRVVGATKDDLHDKLNVLHQLADELRRFGGRVLWRAQGQNYRQYYDVFAGTATISEWPKRYDHSHMVTQVLGAICAPYLRGDPYDIVDGFDTDTTTDYTIDTGAGILAWSGGALRTVNTSTMTRWRHTARGYKYQDCQVRLKLTTGSTVTNYEAGVFLANNFGTAETGLFAELVGGQLRIVKRDNGTPTTLASGSLSLSANTTYWLQLRREGRKLQADVYTSEPSPLGTSAIGITYTLSFAEHMKYTVGLTGFRIVPAAIGEIYDDFRAEPYSYGSIILPDIRSLDGTLIGDGPALAELQITQSGGNAPLWALAGWRPRPLVYNACWNGDFEDDVDGWSVAGVLGVTGAATSIARNTTAARNKYGAANAQIVTPATANTGATFRIRDRFYQGKSYLIVVWASSAAQTTLTRSRLGVNGDIASSQATALGTTPKPYACVWSPTADRDAAYACFEVTQANLTTMNIDGVVVCEASASTLNANITNSAATLVVDNVPDDWPDTPFMAVLEAEAGVIANTEIIRVDSRSGATLTIARGLEGTTGVAHNAGTTIIPLPELRGHLEGKGAQPPVGIIEAESDDDSNRFTWAINADAAQRMDERLYASGLNGSGAVASDWLVDPNLLLPDDFALDELAVEVWARLILHAGLDTPTARIALAPETATISSGALNSPFGAIRYAEEFGASGRVLTKPTSGEAWRMCRLGTLRVPIDRARALRYRLSLRISYGVGTSGGTIGCDNLLLALANARCLSPSRKLNDANYPGFLLSTLEATKTIRSDLSGLVARQPGPGQADHGLGGSLLEFPYGNADVFLKLSNLIPDNPNPDTSTEDAERAAGFLHVGITPQFCLARGSS